MRAESWTGKLSAFICPVIDSGEVSNVLFLVVSVLLRSCLAFLFAFVVGLLVASEKPVHSVLDLDHLVVIRLVVEKEEEAILN